MGIVASYILEKEGTEDVIIISVDRTKETIDLSAATKDITTIKTTLEHRQHLIDLLKYVLADMEKDCPKNEGSYLTKPVEDKPKPEDGDDSISVNE